MQESSNDKALSSQPSFYLGNWLACYVAATHIVQSKHKNNNKLAKIKRSNELLRKWKFKALKKTEMFPLLAK